MTRRRAVAVAQPTVPTVAGFKRPTDQPIDPMVLARAHGADWNDPIHRRLITHLAATEAALAEEYRVRKHVLNALDGQGLPRVLPSQGYGVISDAHALRCQADRDAPDAARWRMVQPGLFITTGNADGAESPLSAEVVFQSAHLDQIAADMYPLLNTRRDGILDDVTPVIDSAIAQQTESTG